MRKNSGFMEFFTNISHLGVSENGDTHFQWKIRENYDSPSNLRGNRFSGKPICWCWIPIFRGVWSNPLGFSRDMMGICMGILGEGVVFIIGVFQRQKWPFLRHDMVSFCRFSFETVQILADMRNHRCPSEKKTAHAKMYQIQLARGGVFGNMDITLIHSPWQSYNGRINLRCILSTPCPPTPRKYG